MRHARDDYNRIQDPLNLIAEDEPVFLLRATDIAAPLAVEAWANFAELSGAEPDIISAARLQAKVMRDWQKSNYSKVPDIN